MTSTRAQHLSETPDQIGAFPRLSDEQIATLARCGRPRKVNPDEVLIRQGETCADFFVILNGRVAVIEDFAGEPQIVQVHGPRRFLGEIGQLKGETSFVTVVACEPGEVLAVPITRLPAAVAHDAVLADLILRAYLVRRSLLVGSGAGFRLIGSSYSPDARRLREFAARNRLPYRWIDVEEDRQAEALLDRFGISPGDTPVVIWQGHKVLRNPSNAEVARLVGIRPDDAPHTAHDLVIVGAGPAGLAAAVYAASEGLDTLVLDAIAMGGQAGRSPCIENYLGFPAGVSGFELADRAVVQARKFGARLRVPAQATALTGNDGCYTVTMDDGAALTGRAVLIAAGARYRRLDVTGLERYEDSCVHYAATQQEMQVCAAQPVAIVGGGNSAGQAALFLADHVPKAYLISRDELSQDMSRYLISQLRTHPRIRLLTGCEVREAGGNGGLRYVVVEARRGEPSVRLEVRNVFVFIGAEPCTAWLNGALALDDNGYVLTGPGLQSSRPGVFAVGDVRSGAVKRVAAAVGEGAMAVRFVFDHFRHRDD